MSEETELKKDKKTKFHIVSFRIDDQDKKILEKMAKEAKLSVSEVLRRALFSLTVEHPGEARCCAVTDIDRGAWRDDVIRYGRPAAELLTLRLDRG